MPGVLSGTLIFHPVRQISEALAPPVDTELAWLAGLVDGEGTIALSLYRGKGTGSVKTVFSISNTNLDNLRRARAILRVVSARDVVPKRENSDWRPAFTLRVEKHSDIRVILRALLPWLVGKQKQADLMLAYLEQCSAAIRNVRGHDSPELSEVRRQFVARMHELNYRYARGEWRQKHPDEIDPALIV